MTYQICLKVTAVRDAYIFNALSSGARIGDYMNFNESNLIERGTETYLEYIQEKTGKSIVAPLPLNMPINNRKTQWVSQKLVHHKMQIGN